MFPFSSARAAKLPRLVEGHGQRLFHEQIAARLQHGRADLQVTIGRGDHVYNCRLFEHVPKIRDHTIRRNAEAPAGVSGCLVRVGHDDEVRQAEGLPGAQMHRSEIAESYLQDRVVANGHLVASALLPISLPTKLARKRRTAGKLSRIVAKVTSHSTRLMGAG